MEAIEIKSLRLKQMAMLNAMIITFLFIIFSIAKLFAISFTQLYLTLGSLILISGIYRFIKGDSTQSIIPIFEKVAVYEKEKMGKEWYKQRKVSQMITLLLSCLLMMQAFLAWNSTNNLSEVDTIFIVIVSVFVLIIVNVTMLIHNKKIDCSTTETDLKGHTWKFYLIATVMGIAFAFAIFIFIIFYVIATIG